MKNIPKAVKLFSPLSLLLLCLIGSCSSKKHLDPVSYVQYLEDPKNELSKEIVSGNMRYTVQLATPEYMAVKELRSDNGQMADTLYAKRLKELEGYTWLVIHIADNQGQNPQTQEQMVMYYEQPASADLQLLCDDAALKPASYHFENNYGLTPYNTIVAAFATGTAHKDQTLEMNFNDRFHQQPLLKAQFETGNLPYVQFN